MFLLHKTFYESILPSADQEKIRQCSVAPACVVYRDQSYSSLYPWFMTLQYVLS
jgi:hypothetical protein